MADTNVWVAAAITPRGVCGQLVGAAIAGHWQPVASPLLMTELEDVLARERFRRWLTIHEAERFIADLRVLVELVDDPAPSSETLTADPKDDFLVTLALATDVAALISGDAHLAALMRADLTVLTPAAFLQRLPR